MKRRRSDEETEHVFLRTKDEKVHVAWFTRDEDDEEHDEPDTIFWEDLKYGDLLCCEDAYRGTDTWMRTEDGLRRIHDSAGYAYIERKESCKIEEPYEFYKDAFDTEIYQGITGLEFDGAAHNAFLCTLVGERRVNPKCNVVYYNGNFELQNPPTSRDMPKDNPHFDEETPYLYLQGLEKVECDPIVALERQKNKVRTQAEDSEDLRSIGEGGYVYLWDPQWLQELARTMGVKCKQRVGHTSRIKELWPATGNVLRVTLETGDVFIQIIVPETHGPVGGCREWVCITPKCRAHLDLENSVRVNNGLISIE